MVELKWTSYSEFNPEGEYFAVIAVDKRKSVWSFFHIVMRGRAVQRQAKTAKGLIGNMGRVEFLGKTVLNFAVFENEKAEAEFVHTGAHAECIETTKPLMTFGGKLAKWQISGSDIPTWRSMIEKKSPKLDDAINKIQSKK